MTDDWPGELHVTHGRGFQRFTGWLDGFVVPNGVRVDFVDFGRRCDVYVVRGGRAVTVLADLAVGRALVEDGHGDGELTTLASALLARRIAVWSGSRAGAADESPLWAIAVLVPSARWMTIG